MNAIEIRNLRKEYKDFKIDDLNLELPEGCIMGLVGENGAGKSTTMKLILNTISRDGGDIKVLGKDNCEKDFISVKNLIGVVPDEASFPEVLNAKQVNSVMKHTYKNWDEDAYFRYLERFSLAQGKAFKEYSRGMKMKLSIAVALSHNARLLVLDEPTSGLDPVVRDEILDILNDYTRDEKKSVLISSHITGDLEKICDYIAFMRKGKILLLDEKDRLLEEYGIIHVSKEEFGKLPADAVCGTKETAYGINALVLRRRVPVRTDRATIEDIFLYMNNTKR